MSLRRMKTYGRPGAYLALLALLWTSPAAAFQFTLGDVQGSFDSTLSYGLSWRVADRDKMLIGPPGGSNNANPNNAYSYNYDDGNLNYDQGDLISNTAKITSELALTYENFGLFVRGSAFYDFENYDGERERTQLSDEALDLVGRDADLLDAYIWWNFDLDGTPGQIRLGDQVLSWGESTFIQNGINVINPFDVGKLRVPGSELKEGLIPVGMVSASISPNTNVTFEGFYQYDWEKVEVDPTGSYWSTNDFAGAGGNKVMLGFGNVYDMGDTPALQTFLGVPRASKDFYADDDGQFGLAMRVYAPGLNDTEFGFYYMNYHSRLPVISAWTGNGAGLTAAGRMQPVVVPAIIGQYANGLNAMVGAGMTAGATQTQAGLIAQTLIAVGGPANLGNPAAAAALTSAVTAAATDAFAKTARYQIEYPEDIQLFGFSFNTLLPNSGVALQGEYSFRKDTPLQADDLELLFAAMGPLNAGFANLNQMATYDKINTSAAALIANAGAPLYVPGYRLLDVSQAQLTATKLFGPTFGADQFTLVGEVGVTYVHNMPSKDELRFDGPGTPISGNAALAGAHYNVIEPSGAFADATSWGYRMVAKLDFNNAIGAVSLSPRIAWSHDVDGTTPGPGGNFIEHRKAITFGLGADYQNTWSADLSYTDFFGASRYNLINDRDFVALNIKYSF